MNLVCSLWLHLSEAASLASPGGEPRRKLHRLMVNWTRVRSKAERHQSSNCKLQIKSNQFFFFHFKVKKKKLADINISSWIELRHTIKAEGKCGHLNGGGFHPTSIGVVPFFCIENNNNVERMIPPPLLLQQEPHQQQHSQQHQQQRQPLTLDRSNFFCQCLHVFYLAETYSIVIIRR